MSTKELIKKSGYYSFLILLTIGAGCLLGALGYAGMMFMIWPILALVATGFLLSWMYQAEQYWPSIKYLKNAIRYVVIAALTIGASVTLGLLSFSGMFLLWPILGLAAAAFFLSWAYEGEIYWQNLAAVVDVLLGRKVLKKQITREFLEEYLAKAAKNPDADAEKESFDKELARLKENTSVPPLLVDYVKFLHALEQFEHIKHHRELEASEKQQINLLQERIKHIEEAVMGLLFNDNLADENFEEVELENVEANGGRQPSPLKALRTWILGTQGQTFYLATYYARYHFFTASKAVSAAAGAGIFIGTAYLLFEAFMTVPLLLEVPVAILPTIIISLGLAAGVAYGLIMYYSINAMINNRTIQSFVSKLKSDIQQNYKEGRVLSSVVKVLLAASLLALVVFLSLATAGTWFKIGQDLAFIFEEAYINVGVWLSFVGSLVYLLFNSLRTWATLDNALDEATEAKLGKARTQWQRFTNHVKAAWNAYWHVDTAAETADAKTALTWNLPRFILKLFWLPVETALFLAHIVSMGVMSDQWEDVDPMVTSALGAAGDALEDADRVGILPHPSHRDSSVTKLLDIHSKPGSGHDHALNLPRKLVTLIISPLYLLAIIWDWVVLCKTDTRDRYSLGTALLAATDRQCGSQWLIRWETLKAYRAQDPEHKDWEKARQDALIALDKAPALMDLKKGLEPSLQAQQFEALCRIEEARGRLGCSVIMPTLAQAKVDALNECGRKIAAATNEDAIMDHLQNSGHLGLFNCRRSYTKNLRVDDFTTSTKRQVEAIPRALNFAGG